MKTGNAFSSNYIEYESNGDKGKSTSIEDYLDKIEPYLNDLVDNHKTQGEWKIQLAVEINFISPKDSDETRTIHTKSEKVFWGIFPRGCFLKFCQNNEAFIKNNIKWQMDHCLRSNYYEYFK